MEGNSCIFCQKLFTPLHLNACRQFKKMLKLNPHALQVPQFTLNSFEEFHHIAVAIKILFYCEELRVKILQNPCEWDYSCKCLLCGMRKLFAYILSINSDENNSKLFISFDPVEKSANFEAIKQFIINSVGDAIKLLLEIFKNLKCSQNLQLFKFFELGLNETFKCKCKKVAFCESFCWSIKAEVNSVQDLGLNFIDVWKREKESKSFKICEDFNCSTKLSKKVTELIKDPQYLLVEVDWNLEYYEIMLQNFSFNITGKELFDIKKQTNYEIFLLCASNADKNFIFHFLEGQWLDIESESYYDTDNMIFNLNSFVCKIDLIVYKQIPLRSEQKKQLGTQSIAKVLCPKCKNLKPANESPCKNCSESNKKWICVLCNTINVGNESCVGCIKIEQEKKMLQYSCPVCGGLVINGQKCRKCLENLRFSEPDRPFSVSSPVPRATREGNRNSEVVSKIICQKCKSPLENLKDDCVMCRVPEETKAHYPPKLAQSKPANSSGSIFPPTPPTPISQKPSEKPSDLPKRPSSVRSSQAHCLNCTSRLTIQEKRNCGSCLKTHSGSTDKCPYCRRLSPMCDSCIKNKKKS